MNRIGTGLLKQSKVDNLKSSHRKDILSILAQANTAEEKALQMKDEDVMSRAYKPFWIGVFTHMLSEIPTFIVAGHETTRYHTRPSLRNSAIEIHKFRILA